MTCPDGGDKREPAKPNPPRLRRPLAGDDLFDIANGLGETKRALHHVGTYYDELGPADRADVDARLATLFEQIENAARLYRERLKGTP